MVASDSILLTNETDNPFSRPEISSTTLGNGDAGAITLSAPSLIVDTGMIDADTLGEGDASRIAINVDILKLRNGGSISSSNGDTTGAGGEVTVNATESISISGALPILVSRFSSIETNTFGQGKAGSINVSAPIVSIDLGAIVQASTTSSGDAGTINLTADSLSLTRGGTILAFTRNAGDGGRLQLSANSISISGNYPIFDTPSRVVANPLDESTGNAGTLVVTASTLDLSDGAEISTSTVGSGIAGALILNVDSLTAQRGSKITSSSTGVAPSANAGSITIEGREEGSATTFLQFANSVLGTDAAGESAGGSITVNAEQVVLTNAQVTTETSEGRGGSINMNAAGSLALSGTTV